MLHIDGNLRQGDVGPVGVTEPGKDVLAVAVVEQCRLASRDAVWRRNRSDGITDADEEHHQYEGTENTPQHLSRGRGIALHGEGSFLEVRGETLRPRAAPDGFARTYDVRRQQMVPLARDADLDHEDREVRH